jgi:hypothetical protein
VNLSYGALATVPDDVENLELGISQ